MSRPSLPFALTAALSAAVVSPPGPARGVPAGEAPSDAAAMHPEASQAVKLVKVPAGLKLDVWATEPLLANPVGFSFDEKGRVFVAETFRYRTGGALDNRDRALPIWMSAERFKKGVPPAELARLATEALDRELAARTVEDRTAMIRAYMDQAAMTRQSERVTLVEDRNNDGKAETSTTFADGFNTPLDGIGSATLARKGEVWFANIPHLWRLRDTNGDGKADLRKPHSSGYGVRYAFVGHDLHGLRIGPDGRIYFSIGDRGINVKTAEGRTLAFPEEGTILRCELDGSQLEVFARGLRNPQDLVFDEHGNLFTGDNNSDGGDKARWVYVVEGGDSGWRVGYQYLEAPYQRGPWNAEKLWHPQWDGQAAYIVPPVENLGNGPSGVTYFPGTGMRQFANRFLMVDFRGQSTVSGVWSFSLAPRGAGWKLAGAQQAIWGVLATDLEFGNDGGLYLLDWVQGWPKPGKGRIYRLHDPAVDTSPDVIATRQLIAEGMAKRSAAELTKLLGHADVRVRQEAQFQLVDTLAVGALLEAAKNGRATVERLHGLWGLGQILRRGGQGGPPAPAAVADTLVSLLRDRDDEVRTQAAKALGDARLASAFPALRTALGDRSPRVQMHAAIALGRVGLREGTLPVLAYLQKNGDRDPYLRHGAAMALAGMGDVEALVRAAADPSPAVRRTAVVALRRLQRSEVSRFLQDRDPSVVREAARAVNDLPLPSAMPALASLTPPGAPDAPTLRRILNANFRVGTGAAAARLAELAGSPRVPAELRVEALSALGDWGNPSGRDRVTGLWRPVEARSAEAAVAALTPALKATLGSGPAPVRLAAARAAERLRVGAAAPLLEKIVVARAGDPRLRAVALRALGTLRAPELPKALAAASRDREAPVRVEALKIQLAQRPAETATLLDRAMAQGTVPEKQVALAALGRVPGGDADRLVAGWLDALNTGKLAPEIALDVLEAAKARSAAAIKDKLAAYEKTLAKDEIGRFRAAMAGGNAEEGRRIFTNRGDVACLRCHAVGGLGGEVGPDLTDIGRKRSREYLLESIAVPNRHLAAGFESVIVTMKDGTIHGGIVKKDVGGMLELLSPEGVRATVKKADIAKRERGASGMPDGLADILTRRELRDLVEYLASLRGRPAVAVDHDEK